MDDIDLQEAHEAEEDVLACLCPPKLEVGHYMGCPQEGAARDLGDLDRCTCPDDAVHSWCPIHGQPDDGYPLQRAPIHCADCDKPLVSMQVVNPDRQSITYVCPEHYEARVFTR